MNPGRALGYRLLGRGFDYLLHLRPAAWPILALHFLTGTALAAGLDGLLAPGRLGVLLLGTAAFVVGLDGGTLALNSAFDRDSGDVACLKSPPRPPRGLAGFGLGAMLLGLAGAAWIGGGFFLATLLCAGLSVLYSVPPIRLKGIAGLDWLVNFLGFGFLTPYAGWALTGRPLSLPGGALLAGFALLFGALYPLTQLYHLEADLARGDRTLAAALGITRTFRLAFAMTALALAGFAGVAGWGGVAAGPAGWIVPAVGGLGWSAALLPWWSRRDGLDPAGHQRMMNRCFLAWGLTDLAVLLGFAR